jgi:TPR repeat protein
VPKSVTEAGKWFRASAEQDFAPAQFLLGVLSYGGEGVPKDWVEAYAWFSLAAKTDERAARERDGLANEMSPQQIASAYQRTKELRAMIDARLPK